MKSKIQLKSSIEVTIDISDMLIVVERVHSNDKQTLGVLSLYDAGEEIFTCKTLELPDLDNQVNISRIKEGFYNLKRHSSLSWEGVYKIAGVPERDAILIHWGNYYTDIQGCILVGDALTDINNDGLVDVINSKQTFDILKSLTGYDEIPILII